MDPNKLTVTQLKSLLLQHNVPLPSSHQHKSYYVKLYKEHVLDAPPKSDPKSPSKSDQQTIKKEIKTQKKKKNTCCSQLLVVFLVVVFAFIVYPVLSGPPVSPIIKLMHQVIRLGGLFAKSPERSFDILWYISPANPHTNGSFVDGFKSNDLFIQTRWGDDPNPDHKVRVRLYVPEKQKKKMPIMLWMHGGGFVMGNIEQDEHIGRMFAKAGMLVLSVEYRLADKHPFPAQMEDVYTVLYWISEHADLETFVTEKDYNEDIWKLGDFSKVITAGASAGANLALTVSMLARDRGLIDVKIAHILSFYPVVFVRPKTKSEIEMENAYLIPKWILESFEKKFITNEEMLENPYVCPLKASSLSGIGNVSLFTAQYDPLLDEGRLLKKRLEEDGVNVTYREYENATHGFFLSPPIIEETIRAFNECIQDIQYLLLEE